METGERVRRAGSIITWIAVGLGLLCELAGETEAGLFLGVVWVIGIIIWFVGTSIMIKEKKKIERAIRLEEEEKRLKQEKENQEWKRDHPLQGYGESNTSSISASLNEEEQKANRKQMILILAIPVGVVLLLTLIHFIFE